MPAPLILTDETFAPAIEVYEGLAVVDFWAAWCGPCRAVAPVVERLAERYAGRVKFAKLDIDAHLETAMRFRVQSIPTLLFFRDGTLVDRTVGALPEVILSAKIKQLLRPLAPVPQAA
jgi:thioredoxin